MVQLRSVMGEPVTVSTGDGNWSMSAVTVGCGRWNFIVSGSSTVFQ